MNQWKKKHIVTAQLCVLFISLVTIGVKRVRPRSLQSLGEGCCVMDLLIIIICFAFTPRGSECIYYFRLTPSWLFKQSTRRALLLFSYYYYYYYHYRKPNNNVYYAGLLLTTYSGALHYNIRYITVKTVPRLDVYVIWTRLIIPDWIERIGNININMKIFTFINLNIRYTQYV